MQSLRIPSPEPCHPDAERKRVLAVSRRRPEATFPRREARVREVQALPPLSRCSAGTPGPLAPRPRDRTSCRGPAGPLPSAEPEPRTSAPPPSCTGARRGRCLGRRGRRHKLGARPGHPRAYLPSGRRRSLARRRARLRARESERETAPAAACLVPAPCPPSPSRRERAGSTGPLGSGAIGRGEPRGQAGAASKGSSTHLQPPEPPARRPRPVPTPFLVGPAPPRRLAGAPPRRLGHPACPAPHPCRSCATTRSCGQILSVLLILVAHLPVVFIITMTRASEVAQPVKVLAATPAHLSSVPSTQRREMRTDRTTPASCPLTPTRAMWHKCTRTHPYK